MMTRQPLNGKVRLLRPADSLDEIAHHVDGTFVLVVKVTGGKYRRRCFLSAASAEKAARNALEAGHSAAPYDKPWPPNPPDFFPSAHTPNRSGRKC